VLFEGHGFSRAVTFGVSNLLRDFSSSRTEGLLFVDLYTLHSALIVWLSPENGTFRYRGAGLARPDARAAKHPK